MLNTNTSRKCNSTKMINNKEQLNHVTILPHTSKLQCSLQTDYLLSDAFIVIFTLRFHVLFSSDSCEMVIVSYENCHNFITESF